MKKLSITFLLLLTTYISVTAQEKKERPNKEQTDMGKWFVQTDLSRFSQTTNFNYNNSDNFSAGLSGGYFIKKNLAITTALSYDRKYNGESFAYKLGAKYYFKNNLFLEADIGGLHTNVFNRFNIVGTDLNTIKTGVNFGYAWFIGKYLSIEPSIRTEYESNKYNDLINLNLNLGFSVHF